MCMVVAVLARTYGANLRRKAAGHRIFCCPNDHKVLMGWLMCDFETRKRECFKRVVDHALNNLSVYDGLVHRRFQ